MFITGLEEGLFPHDNSLNDDGGLGGGTAARPWRSPGTQAAAPPYAQMRMLHGQTCYNVPSRFRRNTVRTAAGLSAKPKNLFAMEPHAPLSGDYANPDRSAFAASIGSALRNRFRFPHRPAGVTREVRSRRDHQRRWQWQERPGRGELRRARHQAARPLSTRS